MKKPTVSVIMATYNHAAFVAQTMDSVLGQRGVELEFLIADDGSTDHTRDVVATNHDSRIRFFGHEINRGACTVTNELIQLASGEFIALINSDDYWISSDKLAQQVQVMHDSPSVGACFGRARFVDHEGHLIDKRTLPEGYVFDQHNRSRGAWLRRFFDFGNCICHPTMLIRRKCYEAVGTYDNRLRQLPDFDMWVRLSKRYDIYVSDMELVAFRHLPGENASSATKVNMRRGLHEFYLILKGFFDGMSAEVFLDGFADKLVRRDFAGPERQRGDQMQIEQCLMFLSKEGWASHIYKLIGLEKLYQLLDSDPQRQLLVKHYGMDDRTFHTIAGQVETLDPARMTMTIPLSGVDRSLLVAELNRRAVARGKSIVRSVLTSVLKRC